MGQRPSYRARLGLLLILLAGCRTAEKSSPWSAPELASPDLSPATQQLSQRWKGPETQAPVSEQVIQLASASFAKHPQGEHAFALAELHYAAATRAAAATSDTCVDFFYQAAAFAYHYLFRQDHSPDAQADERMHAIYHSSLARLIEEGQAHGRLDPKKQLAVRTPAGPRLIPLVAPSGPWIADDIDQLVVVGDYEPEDFTRRQRRSGFGVPLVAIRHRRDDGTPRDEFLLKRHPFAVTAVLHPDLETLAASPAVVTASFKENGPRLDLVDPAAGTTLTISGRELPLAAELSAPLQYSVEATRRFRFDLLGFRQPGRAAKLAGLFLLEPYQRGKVPVVFVHGLMSDPHTWDEMLNELRTDPDLRQRFQFAVFMYPTGNPFLLSAGTLRKELRALQKLNDPHNPDPALGNMVLVGHSMGGVLSRFQVTRSEDRVWDLVARRPFDQIVAPPGPRTLLQDSFFFEPQPFVQRVIFIATPHRGSTLARTIVGRIGASLVTPPREILQTRDVLLAQNPDAFNPLFVRHLPTSVEDLAAGSPILDVMQKLPFADHVRLHSIIGRGRLFPVLRPGDGYVPVTSARLEGVESELYVEATHTDVHRDPESVREVKRILRKHVEEAATAAP